VLLNLVTNAVRFTDPGGSVTLSASVDGDRTSIRVADTGVGIPEDQLESIFRPFVQVDSTLTRKVGGTGLGLTIVRDLTQAMGGQVFARSAVGKGSEFTVVLESAPSSDSWDSADDAEAMSPVPASRDEVSH
jgi:two-component system phosphate regulon sensor histidine kinase PhoR